MTTVAVLQPGYFPWLGFFDQMSRSDVFVIYDDVQFDKHGWRNRNRIKTPNGAQWLTVPILTSGCHGQAIRETRIDNRQPWARKHSRAIAQNYAKAPYAAEYLPIIAETLQRPWTWLLDLDLEIIRLFSGWLDIQPRIELASSLGIEGERSGRLLRICQHFRGSRYLSGNAAQSYLDQDIFARHGITVEWQDYQHPAYAQQHGSFVPYLSALDLLLNHGPASGRILCRGLQRTPIENLEGEI